MPRRSRPPAPHEASERPAPNPNVRITRTLSPQQQLERIFGYSEGLHATHLLAFGEESGAFAQVHKAENHGINVRELADVQGWNEEYTRFFLEAAYALGIFELASEAGVTPRARYRFAPHMGQVLAEELDPFFVGGHARLHILAAQDYRRTADLFRSGKAFPYSMHGEDFLRIAASATRSIPGLFIRTILPRLAELRDRLGSGLHILDIGCGAGWAVVEFAQEFPKSRVVGIDAEPNAIDMAKTLIAFRQLGQRADVRLVRGEEIDYEMEFDLATLFLVLHTIPPKQKAVALNHAARALKKGGYLLLLDEAYPATPAEFQDPQKRRGVLTQWFEGPWGHRLSTREEHRTLLSEAGLRVRQELDEGRYYVVLAQKA